MYFIFLVSVFCNVHNASDISELDKLKTLLNENDSRQSIDMVLYEFFNITTPNDFDNILETSDINKLNDILKPLMDKNDLIKSVNDELYKLYISRNLIILLPNDKESHLKIRMKIIGNIVPKCLGRLIHISILILEYNNFTRLPGFFIKFTSLYRLNLSLNKFKKIPKVIFYLINLIHLDLSMNKIKFVQDDIERLEQLQFLDLSDNYIETISRKFKNLTNLIYLNLCCNKNMMLAKEHDVNITEGKEFMRAIPSSIKCLCLRETVLEYIPCDLTFPNLYLLDVNENSLKDLSLCSIKCFNILVVYAAYNHLTSIPQCSDEFKELRKLSLQGNAMLELVVIKKYVFSALEELYLWDCNINQFEVEGYNIMDSSNGEYIKYENPNINDSRPSNNASNKDTSKPSTIYSLKTLTITVTNIFVIPNLLVFPKLLDLDITNKDSRDFNSDLVHPWFDGLSKMEYLRKLDLVRVNLVTIPSIIFCLKHLESLTLNTCRLEKIPDEITKLSNLKNLDLYDNYIKNINPKIFKFKESINIRLTKNLFSYLPPEINNDELKFNLTINVPNVSLFKNDENNLGVMDISYKKIHKIDISYMSCDYPLSTKELYDEAHKGEEYKWELKQLLEIKQRIVKESQHNYNVIVKSWNVLKKYITNNDIKEKFSNYIKDLYKNKEKGEAIEMIKNYLEAIFEILTNLINIRNNNIVETIINKIEPGLSSYINNQLDHFSYAYYFLIENYDELNIIEYFIKNKIACLKYHALKEITINNSRGINASVYWQNVLSTTLGLPLMPERYYRHTGIWFLECKGYIIYQFFKLITVKNVVKDLYEFINKNHERIMMTYNKYMSNDNDMKNLQEYIEYEGDIKHKNITKITEQGIYFILKKMNLITRGEEQKKE